MYPFLSLLSFMYVPSHTLAPWIGFQSPACNDYGRYWSSIVTSLLISDSRYWFIESALFTGLNALAPLIIKHYDCMHDFRRRKSLIHDDIHCRNFFGLSQMPGKLAKAGYTSWKFSLFFIYERTAGKILFLHFSWWCSKSLALFHEDNPFRIF